jgi:hypothetical protein
MRALQELASRRLARHGRTEFDREPDILGRIVGGTKKPPCSLGQQLHSLTAARTCAIDDQWTPYFPIASTWAGDTLSFTSGSRAADHLPRLQSRRTPHVPGTLR